VRSSFLRGQGSEFQGHETADVFVYRRMKEKCHQGRQVLDFQFEVEGQGRPMSKGDGKLIIVVAVEEMDTREISN